MARARVSRARAGEHRGRRHLSNGTITSPASAASSEWWQEGSVIAARTDQSRVAVGGLHQNTSWDAQPVVGILQSVLVHYLFEHDDVATNALERLRTRTGEALARAAGRPGLPSVRLLQDAPVPPKWRRS